MLKFVKKLGYDIIPVILGILIALILNNLREETQQKKFLDNTLLSILQEHQENIVELDETLRRQYRIKEILSKNVQNDSLSLFDIVILAKGFRTADLHNTSWQSLIYNNKQNLDFKIISYLSKIDKYHEMVEKRTDFMLNNFYSKDFFAKDNDIKKLFLVSLRDLIQTEETIKKDYLAFRKYLKETKGIKIE